MKMSHSKYMYLLASNKGAVTVSLALMLPALIGFYSLAIDGSRFNAERSRLNDAINQSVYAVAVINNKGETDADKQANTDQVANYIGYYLPDKKVDKSKIQVDTNVVKNNTTNDDVVDYQVHASQITHPLLTFSDNGGTGFKKDVVLNGNGLSGAVRRSRTQKSIPTDYGFALDFSTYGHSASGQAGLTVTEMVKTALYQVGQEMIAMNDGSAIALAPYDDGVPVVTDKTNYAGATSKEFGCSYVAKLKDRFETLNWDFWYNKPTGYTRDKYGNIAYSSIEDFTYATDQMLKQYYYNVIAQANGYTDSQDATDWLISKGYCSKDSNNDVICDADKRSSIHNPENQQELNDNFDNYIELTSYVSNVDNVSYGSIINPATVDYEGMVSGDYLFKHENIKKFISFSNYVAGSNPFTATCAGIYNSFNYRKPTWYKEAGKVTKPSFYAVELTTNISDVLSQLMTMDSGFELPNSITGFLRTIPMVAQGTNSRKAIFVLADGDDSRKSPRDELFMDHNLCDVVKSGLKKYSAGKETKVVDLYYIMLSTQGAENDAVSWGKHCVGAENVFAAKDVQELVDIINTAIYRTDIEYVNPEE